MTMRERLWELTNRRPFQPFRVVLKGGETVDVVERFTCIVMPRQIFMEAREGHMKLYPVESVERVDEL